MKKKIFLKYILSCIGLSLFSCHSLVENEFPDFAKVPVLNGLLQADSRFKVQVSLTANLTDAAPTYVSNARVIIESSDTSPDTLKYSEKGWYESPRLVKAGANYTCKVDIPDFPQMIAQTTVPEFSEIKSVVYTDLVGRGEEGEKISSVEFIIPNNLNAKRFWEVQLVSEGEQSEFNVETHKFDYYFGFRNEYIYMLAEQDSVLLHEANPLTLFSNKLMKSTTYKAKFYINESYTNFNSNETSYIELRTVDESYYKYFKQYYLCEMAGWIEIGMSSQKYPQYSNVKNGLGVFTGMSVSRKEISSLIPQSDY